MANSTSRSPAPMSPRRRLAIIVVAAGVALCAGVYFLFTAPATSSVTKNQAALAIDQAANAAAQRDYAVAAAQGAGAGARLYQNTKTLDQLLPQECLSTATPKCTFSKTQFNLLTLSALPAQYGLTSGSVTLCTLGTYQTASYCAYTMIATGTYGQIVNLVRGIGNLTPLTTVQSLLTVPATATTGSSATTHTVVSELTVTLVLHTWFANAPLNPPAIPPGG